MPGVRRSTRAIKKKQPFPDPRVQKSASEDSEQSQSDSEQVMQQPAVRTVQFRKRRGQKMNLLINKKKIDQDEDDFWKNNPYFGDNQHLSGDQGEEEEYVQSSSGRDEFDSDFLSSHSDKEKEKQEQQEQVYVSEDESCSKRKRRNIQPIKPPTKKLKPSTTNAKPATLKYIHEQFTQQQLLAEAAHTQYFNYLSLQKLISLEQGKKVYSKKQHSLPPPKIVYRNRVDGQNSATTFLMVGFEEGVDFLSFKEPF